MNLIILFFLFQAKHYLVDFFFKSVKDILNTEKYDYKRNIKFSLIHSIGTFILTLLFSNKFLAISIVSFFLYFIIEYLTSKIINRFKFTYTNRYFWLLFGLNQFLHNSTYILLISLMYATK